MRDIIRRFACEGLFGLGLYLLRGSCMKMVKIALFVSVAMVSSGSGCLYSSKGVRSVKEIAIDANTFPAVILGGGCAGLTAAVYLSQAGYKPLVIQGEMPGGLITQSHSVRNWPGIAEIKGFELSEQLRTHAENSGALISAEKVIAVDFNQWPYLITLQDCAKADNIRTIKALGCIVTLGTTSNYLKIPGEQQYWGNGVTNCAVCDGGLYAGKVVAVVGGGDAAIVEASYLAKLAAKVYIIVRKGALRAVDRRKDEVLARSNVELLYSTEVQEVCGTADTVTHLTLYNNAQKTTTELPLDGLFLAIGSTPNSLLFDGQLKRDQHGYISLTHHQQTSVPGVFAAGDICDKEFKQAISAAGDACKAALQLNDFLEEAGVDPALFGKNVTVAQNVPAQVAPKAVEAVKQPVAAPQLIEVESMEQFNQLMATPQPKVLDFSATWCGPCKRMFPILKAAVVKFPNVLFMKVDIDKLPELAQTYSIRGVPTFLFIDGKGRIRHQIVGMTDSLSFETEVNNINS